MKVLYLADPHSIHDKKWIQALKSHGIDEKWLIRERHAGSIPEEILSKTLGVIPDFSIKHLFRTLAFALKIKKQIKNNHIQIVHILYAEPNALWVNFHWYFGVPMVITCRGTDILKTIPRAFESKTIIDSLVSRLYKKAFNNASWVTATSQSQIEAVKKYTSRSKNTSLIRTGVNLQELTTDTRSYFPLKDDKAYILFPRGISPNYNHEFSIEAIKLLTEEIKRKYKMVFIGRDSGDALYQEKILEKMALLDGVEIEFIKTQSQKALFELYKRSSLVIMTPLSDGSPVSAMEALLCGKKVILGPLMYDVDLLQPNVTKLKEWDVSELASEISKALFTNHIEPVSHKVQALLSQEYNMKEVKQIYKKLYNG